AIAPTWTAADWDNVGLLVGDREWPVTRCLLTIDLTPEVFDEALQLRADAILAYHPPIFRAVKSFVPSRKTQEGIAAAALAERIAIYPPHTALDAPRGEPNDVRASLAGLENLRPSTAAAEPALQCKLVVFVPEAHVEEVADKVFAAG